MIRAARVEDVRQIGQLHVRIWGAHGRSAEQEAELFAEHFRAVYLENPWYDERMGPLVHQEKEGRITGVLGVVRRPMRLNGRSLWMAVSSELAFDPRSRAQLAAVQMVRSFLKGPQDVSIADTANCRAQKLWHGLGGRTSRPHSLHWLRPLRPFRLLQSLLRKRRGLTPLAACAAPCAWTGDAVAACWVRNPWRPILNEMRLVPLTPEILAEQTGSCLPAGSLSPGYDPVSAQWIWGRLERMFDPRRLHRFAVLSETGDLRGWFVYVMNEGRAEVWQIAARRGAESAVLGQLWSHAWRTGAHAASGRVDPHLMDELNAQSCLLSSRGPSVLIHSREPGLSARIAAGDAWLSHLDGEQLLSCRYDNRTTGQNSSAGPPFERSAAQERAGVDALAPVGNPACGFLAGY